MSSVHETPDALRTHHGSHFSSLPFRLATAVALAPNNDTTVTGVKVNDELVFVGSIGITDEEATPQSLTQENLTDEFSISADDTIIQESDGTDVADSILLVVWNRTHPHG